MGKYRAQTIKERFASMSDQKLSSIFPEILTSDERKFYDAEINQRTEGKKEQPRKGVGKVKDSSSHFLEITLFVFIIAWQIGLIDEFSFNAENGFILGDPRWSVKRCGIDMEVVW